MAGLVLDRDRHDRLRRVVADPAATWDHKIS
jgi:hypothetical protein